MCLRLGWRGWNPIVAWLFFGSLYRNIHNRLSLDGHETTSLCKHVFKILWVFLIKQEKRDANTNKFDILECRFVELWYVFGWCILNAILKFTWKIGSNQGEADGSLVTARLLTGISSTSPALSAQLFGTQLVKNGWIMWLCEIWCQLNWKFWGTLVIKLGWFSMGFQVLSTRDSGDSKVSSMKTIIVRWETRNRWLTWKLGNQLHLFWFENKHIRQYI